MKYKHAESEGWYYYIDEAGNKSPSWNAKNKPVMFAQMQEWEAAGNEIEPKETAEEQTAREAAEAAQALEAQPAICKRLLDETQHTVNGDYDYPQTDVDKYKVWRVELKRIMRSDKIEIIPEKPF
jgi:hypothetical protein